MKVFSNKITELEIEVVRCKQELGETMDRINEYENSEPGTSTQEQLENKPLEKEKKKTIYSGMMSMFTNKKKPKPKTKNDNE